MNSETVFVLDTLWLLISGCLVMWMAAGFAMLEAGLTQAKNNVAILLKNMILYALSCIMYYLVGYALMYKSGIGFGLEGVVDGQAHSVYADFFFQVVFVATAASVISGAVAERMRFLPFFFFVLVLAAVIYPIQGRWTWGGMLTGEGGWLEGFRDFAGSTIVHSVGGWAALAGVMLLGPRHGKYLPSGEIRPIPGSNLALSTLGTFILWFGWFGFNGGSQLALGSKVDANAIALVIVNTNMAACSGAIAALLLTQLRYRFIDLSMVLNGALAGLVSITAGPEYPSVWLAAVIGAIGGLLVVFSVPLMDRLRLDDPVGAISVHLVCGIWGTFAVGLFAADASMWTQLKGIVLIGFFVFTSSLLLWWLLKITIGIRVSEEAEINGLDSTEYGMEAYPYFSKTS